MEPQQSLQPDPPDDDPDQDAGQPPPQPSPSLLDSAALSLVAQPLASAAVRVAASHPLALSLDDLNDFNVDLSWAGADIDSLFLNDTQYLQLGDDPPPSATPTDVPSAPSESHTAVKNPQQSPPVPIPNQPSPSPTPTPTLTQPIPHSQPQQATSLSDPPISSDLPTQNDLPPPRRSRTSAAIQKRSRTRLNQPLGKQNPIPIAPRTAKKPKHLPDLKLKSAPPTPRSMQAQSSPLETARPQSVPPLYTPDRSPASVSRDSRLTQNAPSSVTHFPLGMSPHPMIPLMNMYPLQHHQSMFQQSPPALSPADPNTPDSKLLHPTNTSNPSDESKVRLAEAQSPAAAAQRRSHSQPVAQQPFLSPSMQVMPQGVVPYDTGIMPFFQMAYAAANAGYPQGMMAPMPAGSPNIPSTMLNHFGPNLTQGLQHENPQEVPTLAANASTKNHRGQQPPTQHANAPGGPVVIHEGGAQVLVPQQKAARLERHPVLGRLQLKSASKPQVATSSGLEHRFVSETHTSSGNNPQKGFLVSNRGAASTSRSGSSSLGTRDGGQRQQKKRLVWTPELHDRFVKAINAVGLSQAVPKTLVTIMNVEGLTTEHVKSHLQKYRNSLRKEAAEEERDRSRGAGPSAGPHIPKLGTPGASGASVIHSAAVVTPSGSATNRDGRQGSAAVTDAGGHQRLPILHSRISAFGGQIRGVIQPALEARASTTQAGKPASNSQFAQEITQRRTESHSPRSPSMRSPSRTDGFQANVSGTGTGAASQPSQAPTTTQEPDDGDAMQVDTGAFCAENINPAAREVVPDNITRNPRNPGTEKGAPDTESVSGSPQEAQSAISPGPAAGVGTQVDGSHKAGADRNTEQVLGLHGVGEGDKRDANAGSAPGGAVENPPSASQSNRDLIELMREETQQMQLKLQMVIHRTITLEKKLEGTHSERLNVEASGTADASKRSGVGDGSRSGVESGDFETIDEGEDRTKGVVAVGIVNSKPEESDKCDSEPENGRKKKRQHPSASDEQSELKALKNEQRGLQKRLKDASAIIDKRMRGDGDDSMKDDEKDDEGGDEASLLGGKEDGKGCKLENEGDDRGRDVKMNECGWAK